MDLCIYGVHREWGDMGGVEEGGLEMMCLCSKFSKKIRS